MSKLLWVRQAVPRELILHVESTYSKLRVLASATTLRRCWRCSLTRLSKREDGAVEGAIEGLCDGAMDALWDGGGWPGIEGRSRGLAWTA